MSHRYASLLCAKSRQFKKKEDLGRELVAQLFVILQSARLEERGDLLSDRLADALNLQKTVFIDDFGEVSLSVSSARAALRVGANTGVFSLSSSRRAICSKILAISSLVISSLERARNLFSFSRAS